MVGQERFAEVGSGPALLRRCKRLVACGLAVAVVSACETAQCPAGLELDPGPPRRCVDRDAATDGGGDAGARSTDAGPSPDAAPDLLSAPRLRYPWNGRMTGSVHTSGDDAPRNALRPRFVWEPVVGAEHYEVQLDWRCEASSRATCPFTDPVEGSTATTEWRPDLPLDVSMVAPVGRRYVWRVRSCSPAACSVWSEVRYVDVGRQPGDLNGDGFADVATTVSEGGGRHHIRIYLGPDLATYVTIDDRSYESDVALAGDLNGDGFSDLIATGPDGPCVVPGSVGARTGCLRGTTLAVPSTRVDTGNVGGGGDFDGDGFGDVLFGSADANDDHGQADLVLGASRFDGVRYTASLESASRSVLYRTQFGIRTSLAGDLDGDGYSDAVTSAPYETALGIAGAGRVYVYRGGSSGTPGSPELVTSPTPSNPGGFGEPSIAGDFDGDGFSDLVVVAWFETTAAPDSTGRIYTAPGGLGGVRAAALITPNPTGNSFASGAVALSAASDLDGDGLGDLVVGVTGDLGQPGTLFALMGTPSGLDPSPLRATPSAGLPRYFGSTVAGVGDLAGNGRDVVAVLGEGRVYVFHNQAGALEQLTLLPEPGGSMVFAGIANLQ